MVYFAGAGSGAVDLITVRGMRLLQRADIVIYAGSLVNPELLGMTKETCTVYDSAGMTLEEVIAVMKEAEAAGNTTVRLHTGDPSVYGAVREQMERLKECGIPYESCPGVSACFGAAAALDLEYTLPGISQSLIITRMEGRTAVPEKESIEALAAHQASMAIYLSSGMPGELSRRLLAGGYPADTPAAIVYKATWPEEKKVYCTAGTLEDAALRHGISKTAIILVGKAIGKTGYERSKLYDPEFETGYRRAGRSSGAFPEPAVKAAVVQGMAVKENIARENIEREVAADCRDGRTDGRRISVICFTEAGRRLALRIKRTLTDREVELYCKSEKWQKKRDGIQVCMESLSAWTGQQFEKQNAILFIGSCGIAFRALAPVMQDKLIDVPALVADETGRYIIPVLSGHYGGANALALAMTKKLGMEAVITTATDLHQSFAVDVFARRNGLAICNRDGIKRVSAAILAGETVSILMDGPYEGQLPGELTEVKKEHGVSTEGQERARQTVSILLSPYHSKDIHPVLQLCPRAVVIGIGCRRGKCLAELETAVNRQLAEWNICQEAVSGIASIDLKKEEKGLCGLAEKYGWEFLTYSGEELQAVPGVFTASGFVKEKTGVENVCERAALAAAGKGGCLSHKKKAADGITVAAAVKKWSVSFE